MPRVEGLTISIGRGKTIRPLYFGAFLVLAGIAVLSWLTLQPLVRVFAARSWVPTPCTILSSKLAGSADRSGTHLIAIAYEYTFQQQIQRSDRYGFVPAIPTAGYEGKQAVIAANPPGRQTTCFVNPAAPAQAVLERGATLDFLWGLASLPFVLVGTYIIVSDMRTPGAAPSTNSERSKPLVD